MGNQSKSDDLLKAADEYAKNKGKDKPDKQVKEIPISNESEDSFIDHDVLCDDPDCASCRLIEYESFMYAYLEDLASDQNILPQEAKDNILEESKLVQIIATLMIRIELLETQLDFLSGNEDRVLFRIHSNPLYQKIMEEKEKE